MLLSHKTKTLEPESKHNHFFEEKAKRYCKRSEAKGLEEKEVCSKYFLSLEKQRQSNNVIRKVKLADTYVSENNNILEESLEF